MNLLLEILIFLPMLGIACIPLGIAVLSFDSFLYSRWVPVMRQKMSERKWPAVLIACAPVLSVPTLSLLRDQFSPALAPIFDSSWPPVIGGAVCVAFSACWLKLPDDAEEDDAPPARSLTSEWLLAVGMLVLNYIGMRLMPHRW